MLVDGQIQLWGDAPSSDRSWSPPRLKATHRAVPPGVDETLAVLDASGVERAVIVPPSWAADGNETALAAAAEHPRRFGVMGRIPLVEDVAVRAMPTWRRQQGMLGIRITLHREPWRSAFRAGAFSWLWPAAEAAAVPIMVYAPGLLVPLAIVAHGHPGLRLIIDHLALPQGLTGTEAFEELEELLALSMLPNVAVQASALPRHSREPYPFSDLHEPVRRVLDAFGPDRVFWGSDWTRLPCSYEENVRLFTEELDFLSDDELRLVMGDALLEWLGWPADTPG